MRRGAEAGCSYCKWGRKRWKARSGTQRWAAYLSWHAAFPMIKPWTTQGGAGSFVPQAQLLSSHTLLPLAASLGHVFALCELELFFHCLTTNICFFYLSCPLIFHFRYLLFISLFYKKKSCQTLNRGQVFQPSSVKNHSWLLKDLLKQLRASSAACLRVAAPHAAQQVAFLLFSLSIPSGLVLGPWSDLQTYCYLFVRSHLCMGNV